MLITPSSHPTLFRALNIISHDCGAGCHTKYSVVQDEAACNSAERALAKLSKSDLETFCIGEEKEYRAIRRRTRTLLYASEILTGFFNRLCGLVKEV